MIRAVVFDLDDTLYLERDYVASGFREIAVYLSSRSLLCESEIFRWLWDQFISGARRNTFDRLLQQFPPLSRIATVPELITRYREHTPRLELLEGIGDLLDTVLAEGARTGIITDGPAVCQTAKLKSLALGSRIHQSVQTDRWGMEFYKPHPRAYEYIAAEVGVAACKCVYVGDNPEKDFSGARSLGWGTVRLRLPGQLHYATDARIDLGADFEAESVASLTGYLLSSLERD